MMTPETFYYLRSYLPTLLIGAVGCTPLPKRFFDKADLQWPKAWSVVKLTGLAMVLLLSTACLVDGSFNPFLYFRF